MTPTMEESVRRRRSVGIGITGLAGFLYKHDLDYDGSYTSLHMVSALAEKHMFSLYKASIKMADEQNESCPGIDTNWLPIDTMRNVSYKPKCDWESIRGRDRIHSVLVAHMPTESSAILSDAPNGLYPVRKRVINKGSRVGLVQYIAPAGDYITAWEVDSNVLAKYYALVQDWTDQAISADNYVNFNKYPDGKIPLSELMKHFITHFRLGNKTMYYVNTNDNTGGSFQDQAGKLKLEKEEEGCESGACKL